VVHLPPKYRYNGRMAAGKKRIGLVLASIHTGVALNVWAGFARTASAENTSLFIFPGGRLNAPQDYENLRNPVYYLVNEENLDGCITWSSTFRYTQSSEEFALFHANFDPLPYVTLACKAPGHPCVEFDAYGGMKAMVSHCIQVHGARKIAFLRGPDFHQSAQVRLEGYRDALKEAGLVSDGQKTASADPLITDPFNWNAGDAAAAQLLGARSLVPGRDFDTLIGSSDLMTLGAINYLAEKGYHVPGDYRAAGFNNSAESRVSESPLSTVHLPYAELSRESFKMLLRLMDRRKIRTEENILLPTELIIRESCGCVDHARPRAPSGQYSRSPAGRAGFYGPEESLAAMAKDYLGLEAADARSEVLPLVFSLLREETERSFPLFEKALVRFFNSGREVDNLLKYIALSGASGLIPDAKARVLEPALLRIIFKVREQMVVHAGYEKERWNTVLNSLKCDLLGTRDRDSLIRSLARHLPKIGINTAAIVLYGDEKTSVCVGSFSPCGISPRKEERFSARLLVPAALKQQYADGIFMIQPLFIENQSLGYFAHNVPIHDGLILEELRSAVSYALKGIFLLEETVRAKRIAEQAERAKTEFLQTLENSLYDPLQGVMDRLEELGQAVRKAADAGEVTKSLEALKSFVASREAEAGSLIDFTLARVDELSLRKTIFDPAELLPGIGNVPLLSGDTARLAQCFSLVRAEYDGGDSPDGKIRAAYSAVPGRGGLEITFRGRRGDAGEKRRFGLLLAERIVLMHGGDFFAERERCVITLPWTTLTGQEFSRRPASPQDHILTLRDPAFLPADFFTLPRLTDIEKAAARPGRTAFIVWDAAGAGPEDLIWLAGLRRRSEFAGTPFLCYGGAGFGPETSIFEAAEHALKSPRKGTVLLVGPSELWGGGAEELFPETAENAGGGLKLEKIRIASMAAFSETVSEISPSLIVFNSLNPAGAAAIRRHPVTAAVPIVMISGRIDNADDVMALGRYSRLVICHRAAASSPEFRGRVRALAAGGEILPPHTGILVKKAILYFGLRAGSHISRWKLADSINVSEDYLTHIFHREMGLSLWDYINRCRIFLAAGLLRETDDTIQDIAFRAGFQDQAYFCRVFKKIYGVPPGHLRKG
jgi:DNA-binding LacI/PurR family transcriptional regulator/AraC-like DNA-binding protein